jgi:hypothetical protein
MFTKTKVPKHLKPRIKPSLGCVRYEGSREIPIEMWECKLNHETAVAGTPRKAWELFVYGHDGYTTTHRLKALGLL